MKLPTFGKLAGPLAARVDGFLRQAARGWSSLLPTAKVKQSAIPYAGYEYQTLQGVRTLAQWLDSPTKYRRVRFEADKDIAPQGLDDIVCERGDGRYDFLQVKFSPSPEKEENQLSWQWLLGRDKNKPRSRSLLRKWHDALGKVEASKLGEVCLLTNRIPDALISASLRGNHLEFTSVPAEVEADALQQFGDLAVLRAFLRQLIVLHSDKGYLTLRREVGETLRKHTDDAGVQRLYSHARDWAIFDRNPGPDGWITLELVRAVLSVSRPEPIPEDFSVPDDYEVPDEEFHDTFKESVLQARTSVLVLTGPPGRGKSTYLSFLCREFDEAGIPYVRHHYFLSVGDRTSDRLSPRVVAEALIAQISARHSEVSIPTDAEHLGTALEACARHYEGEGQPFVVVIDGLDHVWRDNDRDKRPLDDLFSQLIPVPENLILLIGTQPVDDDKLPNRLTGACARKDWHELPPMSGNAVAAYLVHQVQEGRLRTRREDADVHEEVAEGAAALHQLTRGHPLHVIYAVEELIAKNRVLTDWEVEQLPACPGPDIRSYYGELWRRLTASQRDILHLTCAFPFYWPRTAFGEMALDVGNEGPAITQVEHLLHSTASGLKPFHESLIVFIREQERHEDRVARLTPRVRDWLTSSASEVLRQSWLWSIELRLGNDAPIRTGVTRSWVIERLAAGYSQGTMLRLLREAETAAFQSKDYAEAYRHRALKTRLLNGPEFQIADSWRLYEYSLITGNDASVVDDAVSSRQEFGQRMLAGLTLALAKRQHPAAQKVGADLLSKYRRDQAVYQRHHAQEQQQNSVLVLQAAGTVDALDLESIVAEEKLNAWPPEYCRELCRVLEARGDVANIVKLWTSAKPGSRRALLEVSAIRGALVAGADITAWAELQQFESSALAACFTFVCRLPARRATVPVLRASGKGSRDTLLSDASSDSVCAWFFASLLTALTAEGPFEWLDAPQSTSEPHSGSYLDALTSCAAHVSERLKAGDMCDFSLLFTYLADRVNPNGGDYEQHRAAGVVRQALPEIAAGVLVLCSPTHSEWRVSSASLRLAMKSPWFNRSILRSWYAHFALDVFAEETAEFIVEDLLRTQATVLSETNERAEELLVATGIALKHNLLALASKTCSLCWELVLGYGAHKDMALLNLLESVKYFAEHDIAGANGILSSISPQIDGVTEYTDGDETRHVHSELSELLARIAPNRLSVQYRHELRSGNWHRAEDAAKYLFQYSDLSSPAAASFARSGASVAHVERLRERGSAGDARASELLAEATTHLGGYDPIDEDGGGVRQTETSSTDFTAVPAEYPPSRFKELRADMDGTLNQREYLATWYDYWAAQGKESDLLRVLEPAMEEGLSGLDYTRYLLDKIFESTVRREGKKKAFAVLVKAQVELSGWSGRMFESTERSEARLKRAAELYAVRSDEFIQQSCKSWQRVGRSQSSLVVPGELLVFYLLEVGREDEARKLLEAMVSVLHEDTRTLPLTKPEWA